MYKRILVPIDGSHTAKRGLDEAIRLAKDQKAELRILHIVDQALLVPYAEAAMYWGDMASMLKRDGQRLVERAQVRARAQRVQASSVLHKDPALVADAILRHAKKWRADLIVLGTHGRRGISRMVMGSDAELVVRSAPVPVLLVRSKAARAKH